MYKILLSAHSGTRYLLLLALVVVIFASLFKWINKQAFTKSDDRLSLFLLIFTHIQFLLGLVLYFISPWVDFSGNAMRNALTRYWTMEHSVAMIIAVVLITIARSSSKKLADPVAKHRRLFILNFAALVIIVGTILMSDRPIL